MALFKLAPYAALWAQLHAAEQPPTFVLVDPHTRRAWVIRDMPPQDHRTLLRIGRRLPGAASSAVDRALAGREYDAMRHGQRRGSTMWQCVARVTSKNGMMQVRFHVAGSPSAQALRRTPGCRMRFTIDQTAASGSISLAGRCAVAATIHRPTGEAMLLPVTKSNILLTWLDRADTDKAATNLQVVRPALCVACGRPGASHRCPRCNLARYCSPDCLARDARDARQARDARYLYHSHRCVCV